jgi:hypothetical protein
LKVKKGKS